MRVSVDKFPCQCVAYLSVSFFVYNFLCRLLSWVLDSSKPYKIYSSKLEGKQFQFVVLVDSEFFSHTVLSYVGGPRFIGCSSNSDFCEKRHKLIPNLKLLHEVAYLT